MQLLNQEEIKSRIKTIIVEDLDASISMEEIQDSVSLYDDGLGLDSIAIINLIVLIEKKFGISINENEISARLFSNINTLAEFIGSKEVQEPAKSL